MSDPEDPPFAAPDGYAWHRDLFGDWFVHLVADDSPRWTLVNPPRRYSTTVCRRGRRALIGAAGGEGMTRCPDCQRWLREQGNAPLV
ncbi:hypothetical protein [Actinokineospora enzanensis]|uniref:hypothetical protein n=1 Tax=Actinokineospora enzanensis TaxID=155975 RepID=UPI00037B4909|nr:hypothetical protein [Actinokineospora enzanensis]